MASVVCNLTAAARLRGVGVILFGVWTVAFVVVHAAADGLVDGNNIILGRDFMAFYLGGQLVRQGQGEELYEPVAQQATQAKILEPETADGFSYFINPASVAVAYSLITVLPYEWAFYVHTIIMLAVLFAGVWVLRRHLPGLSDHWVVVALLGATWMPMMHTITGGQNAALTFALLAFAYAGTVGGQQWLAGLALGLLLFKPQYALPFIGLLLLRRQWMTVAVAGAVGAGHYLVGALWCGWNWPLRMADKLGGYYREAEDLGNSATHMSILEVLDYSVIEPLAGSDAVARTIHLVGYAMVALIVIYLMWVWRRADPGRADFGAYWALLTAAALLISPHTQYYDGALLVLPILLLLAYMRGVGQPIGLALRGALILLYVGYFALVYMPEWFEWFRFQPAILAPVWICCWAVAVIGARHPEAARELAAP